MEVDWNSRVEFGTLWIQLVMVKNGAFGNSYWKKYASLLLLLEELKFV